MSKKKTFEKLTPGGGHEVAEPAVGYGLQSGATAILDGDDETMSIEKSRAMTNAAVRREYALGRDMTPEELYKIIAEEIDAIYAEA